MKFKTFLVIYVIVLFIIPIITYYFDLLIVGIFIDGFLIMVTAKLSDEDLLKFKKEDS